MFLPYFRTLKTRKESLLGLSREALAQKLAPHIDRHYILTSQEVSLSVVEEDSRNYRDVFGDADGLVLINSRRPKRSQMIVNRLQDWYLESYRRRDLRGVKAPVAY